MRLYLLHYNFVIRVLFVFNFQLVALVLIKVEHRKAIVTSGILFLFYLLLVLAGVVPFYMKIIEPDQQVIVRLL